MSDPPRLWVCSVLTLFHLRGRVSALAPSFANRSQFTRDKSWDQGGPKLGAQPACYGALGPSLWSLAWFVGGHVTPGLLKAPCGDCPGCCPEVDFFWE